MDVIVADDHELFREGLKLLVRDAFPQANVLEAGAFYQVLELIASGVPCDLLLLDLHMPGLSSPASELSALCDGLANARVVVLSADEQRERILDAVKSGAHGYIFKSSPAKEIQLAIECVMRNEIYLPPVVALARGSQSAIAREAPDAVERLTPRQRDVFNLMIEGQASRRIAQALRLSVGTVKIHLASIYRLLGVRSRAEAIAKYASDRRR